MERRAAPMRMRSYGSGRSGSGMRAICWRAELDPRPGTRKRPDMRARVCTVLLARGMLLLSSAAAASLARCARIWKTACCARRYGRWRAAHADMKLARHALRAQACPGVHAREYGMRGPHASMQKREKCLCSTHNLFTGMGLTRASCSSCGCCHSACSGGGTIGPWTRGAPARPARRSAS